MAPPRLLKLLPTFVLGVLAASFIWIEATHASDAEAFIRSGNQKYQAKDIAGAIAEYSKAIEADPKSSAAFHYRALSKSFLGDWKGCLEDVNSALELSRTNIEFLSTRAFAHLETHDFPAATADFKEMEKLDVKKGAELKRSMAQRYISRARSKSAGGNQLAAIADYDIVIALYPDLAVAYHERGGARSSLKMYKEAIADYDLAIKLPGWHNQYGDSFGLRAKAKRALGDNAGAEADEAEAQKRQGK